MKVRVGFVSNSSSSSFCIFGTEISELEAFEIIQKQDGLNPDKHDQRKWYTKYLKEFIDERLTGEELFEAVRDQGILWELLKTDLTVQAADPEYWDHGFIGYWYGDFTSDKNKDRKVSELITELEKELTDLLGRKAVVAWHAGEVGG